MKTQEKETNPAFSKEERKRASRKKSENYNVPNINSSFKIVETI